MIKKILSSSPVYPDLSLLFFRVCFSIGMITHGWSKWQRYPELKDSFTDYLGIGSQGNLILVIFAELICPVFIILGLGTRLASLPIIIAMAVALFIRHADDPFGRKELAFIYLFMAVFIFLKGPGKISADSLLFGK